MATDDRRLFCSGNAPFIRALYARLHAGLIARAVRHLHNLDEAEDAAAETWEVAWEERDEFLGEESLEQWLAGICTRICLGRLRDRKREARVCGEYWHDLEHQHYPPV